jgi:hypothetical protein
MTDKDILFKDLKGEELAKKPQDEIAHFGWGGNGAFSFFLIAEAYYESAETLYQKMRSAGKNFAVLDGHIYPMVFLYRHFIELYLRGLYLKYSGCSNDQLKQYFTEVGHDLNASWIRVKPLLSKGKKHVGSSQNIGAIEHYIHEMNRFDSSSMGMRYPIDKKTMAAMCKTPIHLDYVNLHDRMAEFHKAIESLNYDIENQVNNIAADEDIASFLENYHRQESTLKRYLTLVQEAIADEEQDEDDETMSERVFADIDKRRNDAIRRDNGEEVEDDYLSIYQNSGDDLKIIIEVLYYAGRSVREHLFNLSTNPEERRKEFITCCLEQMKYEGFKFGEQVHEHQTNVFGKCAREISANISLAQQLIGSDE